jgi:hypothetical protein
MAVIVTPRMQMSAFVNDAKSGFNDSTRVVGAFLGQIPGISKAISAAFPVIGLAAFGTLIVDTGEKLKKFFDSIAQAPAKIVNAFRELQQPLRLTNDELLVTNDRLANDIAKLEGRRQNTLKLALDEAKVAADKLADSLEKDLTSLNKLLKEQNVGFWRELFGEAGTESLQEEMKKFADTVNDITERGQANISAAGIDPKKRKTAQDQMDGELRYAHDEEIKALKDRAQAAKPKLLTSNLYGFGSGLTPHKDQNTAVLDAAIQRARNYLIAERSRLGETRDNQGLTGRKAELSDANAAEKLQTPYQNALKNLNAEIAGIQDKLAAIGKPEAEKIAAEATAEWRKEVTKLNEEMSAKQKGAHLTSDQEETLKVKYQTEAAAKATLQWRESLQSTETTVQERIKSLNMLAAAIGEGYEATKKANVETQVMGAMKQKYNDPAFSGDQQKLRAQYGTEFDAKHNEQTKSTLDKLGDQIELEKALAAVQRQGAEATALVTLRFKLDEIAKNNDAESTKKLQQTEIDLFNATKANHSAEVVARIADETAALKRLTDASTGGAEAVRKAQLQNQLTAIGKQGGAPVLAGLTAEQLATAGQAQATRDKEIAESAGKLVTTYGDQLRAIQEQVAYIKENAAGFHDQLGVEIALRDLENERLKIAVQMELKQRDLKSGIRAFFLEMQEQAKSTGEIIYDALKSSLDRVSDETAKFLTGQKTDWAKAFQQIGQEIIRDQIKSSLQQGLGKIGQILFPNKAGATVKKPTGNVGDPIHVVVDNQGGAGPGQSPTSTTGGGGILGKLGGLFGSGSKGGGIFSLLPSLFKGAGAGAEQVTSSMGPDLTSIFDALTFPGLAGGSDNVDPGKSYWVGDGGEAELFRPRIGGSVTPASKIGGGDTHYHIDARGAELGAYNRIERSLEAVHRSIESRSARQAYEAKRRTPQLSHA